MALKDRIVQIAYELKDRFTRNVGKITGGFEKIERSSGSASNKVDRNVGIIERSFFSLRKTALTVAKSIAAMFAAAAGTATAVFNATKTYQQLNASLKTVTGSAENAQKAFEFISDFASTTPFQLEEVSQAFIKLKALGLDPSREALTSYGNTAAAMGKSLDQFIEAVADAATGEFERLKEFGIKASQQGDQVSFTFQGVTTTIGKNAAEIEGYLRQIGEVQFAGAMEEQMDTIGGRLSNLQDQFFRLAVEIGEAGVGDAVSTVFDSVTQTLNVARDFIKNNTEQISEFFFAMVGGLRLAGNTIRLIFNTITTVASSFGLAISTAFGAIAKAIATITFGDVSRRWQLEADGFRRVSETFKRQIAADAQDIVDSANGIAGSFDQPKIQIDEEQSKQQALSVSERIARDIEETFGQSTPVVNVGVKTDQNAAVASVNAVRDAAQAQIKPIEIPVVYRRGNSFSDRPFEDEVTVEAVKRGRRG